MITVYGKTRCPYTSKVIDVLDAHRLSFVKKNIADQTVLDELIEKGGKRQVPYLIDGDVSMYESDAITTYIEDTYGSKSEESGIHFKDASQTCPGV